MSLLINGMEMPRHMTTRDYTLRMRQDGTAELIDRAVGKSYEVINVPTVHGRLIDADELSVSISKAMYNGRFDSVIGKINTAPTIIEAEEENNELDDT